MDIQQLKQQVTQLLHAVAIEEEERQDLLSRVETSTQEQLEQLEDNLLRQIAADTYFAYLEELEQQDRLLDEEDVPGIEDEIIKRIMEKQSQIFTQAQMDQVRAHIGEISATANTAPAPDFPPPTTSSS